MGKEKREDQTNKVKQKSVKLFNIKPHMKKIINSALMLIKCCQIIPARITLCSTKNSKRTQRAKQA